MRGARPFVALEAQLDRTLIPDDARLVVAASGGPDSAALTALVAATAPARRWHWSIAHINHGLRDSAWQDEAVAASLAARFAVKFVARSIASDRAGEAHLRERRYAALQAVVQADGARYLLTAHNAQDQTETVLLALFRGTGLEGLRGMPGSRMLAGDCALVRPLLRVPHEVLVAYCHARAVPYALDPSNAASRYRRNVVRAALEAVRAEVPALDVAVARTAQIVAAELAGSDEALARRRIRELLRADGGLADVSFERVEAAAQALLRGGSGRIFMKPGVEVSLRGDTMEVTTKDAPPPEMLPADIEAVIFSEAEISGAVGRLAAQIAADYRGQPLLLVGVLKGALFFAVDLARALSRLAPGPSEIRMDFLAVSSYGNAHRSSGEVRLLKDTSESVEGQNVLIVEDIVDNGLTLDYLRTIFAGRGPLSLRSCVLFDKPYRRSVDVPIEYKGLVAPDEFVVGYGLDYQERYRGLPFLAKLHPSVFQ